MRNTKNILNIAKKVIEVEKESISQLSNQLTKDFTDAVDLIYKSNGRLIISGVGKSANIASKIVATFNSTGKPAIFIHATEAIHGDLGNIQKDDIIICISKSGNTKEIKQLIVLIRSLGNKIISICGNKESFLSKESDYFLDSTVEKEACPNNLAPTSSTTAQLVLGDALAICLLELNNFSDEDFARFHPGGILGKRLFLKVSDIIDDRSSPIVYPEDSIKNVIIEISNKRLGATAVIKDQKLLGIITDGDLRRMLEKNSEIDRVVASDIMTLFPKRINVNDLATNALRIMKQNNVSQLIVMDEDKYIGILHMHDILKEGI